MKNFYYVNILDFLEFSSKEEWHDFEKADREYLKKLLKNYHKRNVSNNTKQNNIDTGTSGGMKDIPGDNDVLQLPKDIRECDDKEQGRDSNIPKDK